MTRAKNEWMVPIRMYQDLTTREFSIELQYQDLLGTTGSIRVSRDEADDPRGAKKRLLALGVPLPATWLNDLRAALSRVDLPVVQTTSVGGWFGNAYVREHAILGDRGTIRPLHPELKSEAVGGTAKAWKSGLTPICERSHYLTFAIAVAFSGPLLRKLGHDEGSIFHLYGETSTGKSTALLAAMSVYEKTGRDRLRTFDMTPRGLEEQAAASNDGLFVVDEAGRIGGEGKARKKHFSDVAFIVAGGQGRIRSEKATADATLRNLRFLVMGLSTGEEPIDGKGEAARRGGEQVRLISIPLPRQHGLFNLEPEDTRRAALFAAVQEVVARNYGVALKPFVNGLVSDDQAVVRAQKRVDRFMRWAMPQANAFGERFARKFAVVYAAGLLAVDLGIAPWSKKHLGDSLREVFAAAWKEVRPADVEAGDFVHDLVRKAEDERYFPLVEKGERFPSTPSGDEWGIRRTIKGRMTLAVFREGFSDLVWCSAPEILNILASRGLMLPGREEHLYVTQLRIKGRGAGRANVLMFDLETLQNELPGTTRAAAE
ncbi:MAG: DUF927 domain-containing protein [Rhizobiales bacterium]|nr:DUF927 domain-containing protein [Hyphomicrobiales bacterium]